MSGVPLKEVLPKQGELYQEDLPSVILCKPKLIPLKSVTLEKLEKMQNEAQDMVRQQELEAQQQLSEGFRSLTSGPPGAIQRESTEVNRLTF